MNAQRFQDLAEAYGADPRRWPEGERAAAGAFMDADTRQLLKEKAIIIWLHATIETVLHRVGNKNTRPLLNQKNKRAILEDLAAKRYPTYAEADLKFDTTDINHDTLIVKIIREIKLLKNEK